MNLPTNIPIHMFNRLMDLSSWPRQWLTVHGETVIYHPSQPVGEWDDLYWDDEGERIINVRGRLADVVPIEELKLYLNYSKTERIELITRCVDPRYRGILHDFFEH